MLNGVLDIACVYPVYRFNGTPVTLDDATEIIYMTREEVFRRLRSPTSDCCIVGPEGRVGRMARMILDGISIHERPTYQFEENRPPLYFAVPFHRSYQVVQHDRTEWLVRRITQDLTEVWRRLDPFTESGFVEL